MARGTPLCHSARSARCADGNRNQLGYAREESTCSTARILWHFGVIWHHGYHIRCAACIRPIRPQCFSICICRLIPFIKTVVDKKPFIPYKGTLLLHAFTTNTKPSRIRFGDIVRCKVRSSYDLRSDNKSKQRCPHLLSSDRPHPIGHVEMFQLGCNCRRNCSK